MLISLREYGYCFREHNLHAVLAGCAVRNRDQFAFLTETVLTEKQFQKEKEKGWDPTIRPKGFLLFWRTAETKWYGNDHMNWKERVVGTSTKPRNHSVVVERFPVYPSLDSRSFVTGGGTPAHEETPLRAYSQGGFLRGDVSRLKMIDGWLYACGGGRSLGKRLDEGNWQSLTYTGDLDVKEKEKYRGFDDFDGFGEQDIYAAGSRGDVWHFDGKAWKRVPFPSDMEISSVCCGGDEKVYISGEKGVTFCGLGDRWQEIDNEEVADGRAFRDMVWYEGKVWATNDDGLWVIENGAIKKADVPDDVEKCVGHLSAGDGVLLLAGAGGAAFKENGEWNTIILIQEMDRQFVEAGMEPEPLDRDDWY